MFVDNNFQDSDMGWLIPKWSEIGDKDVRWEGFSATVMVGVGVDQWEERLEERQIGHRIWRATWRRDDATFDDGQMTTVCWFSGKDVFWGIVATGLTWNWICPLHWLSAIADFRPVCIAVGTWANQKLIFANVDGECYTYVKIADLDGNIGV